MATRRTYKCKCGTKDIKQSIKDEPIYTCPDCGEEGKQIFHIPTLGSIIGMTEISRRNAYEVLEKGY